MADWQDDVPDERPISRLQRIFDWKWRIFSVGRFPVFVHWSVLLLPLLITLDIERLDLPTFLIVLAIHTVTIYGSILLHELGHAIAAVRCGYRVKQVDLYLLGGLATLGRGMRSPNHEWVVVAMGPFMNLVLIGVAVFFSQWLLPLTGVGSLFWRHECVSLGYFFYALLATNLVQGTFNLIPMFPLDGGWLARSLLSMRYHPNLVTVQLGTFGMWVVAPLMGLTAILGFAGSEAVWLFLIALLGWLSCRMERQVARHVPIYQGGSEEAASPWSGESADGWKDSSGMGAVYGGWAAEKETEDEPGARSEGFFARLAAKRAEKEAQRDAEARAKVDELLAKIARDGMASLTKQEREVLERESKRFRQNG